MRLGIVYLSKGGGIANCTYELAKAAASYADVTCYIASDNVLADDFTSLSCQTRVVNMRRGAKSLLLSMLTGCEPSGVAEVIKGDRPDIVVDTGSGGWSCIIQRKIRGHVPFAQMVHDVTPHPDWGAFVDSIPGRVRPPVVDAFVSLSEFSHRELTSKYPKTPCISSLHGVILARDDVDPAAVAAKRKRLLFFGRIDPYKGLSVLVDAFRIARRADPELDLSVVGRGEIKQELIEAMREMGVRLTNEYVTDAAIKELIAEHGIMVLPYTSATQSGVAAVALGNGLPCVATDVGALPEQVVHGTNGLVVPPNDPEALAQALVEISGSESMAQRMSENSIVLGKTVYSWDFIGRKLVSDLEAFLNERK